MKLSLRSVYAADDFIAKERTTLRRGRAPCDPRRISAPGPAGSCLRPGLAGELVQGAELDLGARPLRARDMGRPDVRALDAGGPRAVDRVDERREVAEGLVLAERSLPYDGVDDAGL